MDSRLKSALASILLQGTLGYALVMALVVSRSDVFDRKLATVNVSRKVPAPSPPNAAQKLPASLPVADRPVVLHDWAATGPEQRNLDFIKARKWVNDNLSQTERRLAKWREAVPQGTGPAAVTRLQPANLMTHTLYWPAKWSRGPLPVIAWGNGGCNNSSLPYAAFLSEIASHGYFVIAVGNDDIDFPQPEGLEVLADGRPVHTQAGALRRAIDWAVAENVRPGSDYRGKLETGKIAYMGHACGGEQALAASSDPRTTTAVVLNSAARIVPAPSRIHHPPLADFASGQDDAGIRQAGDANLSRAQDAGWPIYRAVLEGVDRDGAYSGPDRRWSKAVIAWLDWQLKGTGSAKVLLRSLAYDHWRRIAAIGFEGVPMPVEPVQPPKEGNAAPLHGP